MRPYLKFYLAKNPAFGKPFDSVKAPSVEEWKMLFEHEPTKVNPNYDDFVKKYVERKTHSLEQLAKCEFTIQKVAISEETNIKKVEEQKDFVRWHGVKE
jgi:hypothetical protein